MISPVEIRQYKFKSGFRGYNPDDVKAFLDSLSREWEDMIEKNKLLAHETDKLNLELKRYKDMEDILQKTLMHAEQSSQDAQENAKKSAEMKIKDAELKFKEIVGKAYDERSRVEREVMEIEHKRDDILMQLKIFLQGQSESLSTFEKIKDHTNKTIPSTHTSPAVETGIETTSEPIPETSTEAEMQSQNKEKTPVKPAPKEPEPLTKEEKEAVIQKTIRNIEKIPTSDEQAMTDNASTVERKQTFFERAMTEDNTDELVDDILNEL